MQQLKEELIQYAAVQDLDNICLANPSDWGDLHALLLAFPDLVHPDSLPELSNAVAQHAVESGLLAIGEIPDWRSFRPAFGARSPAGTSHPIGSPLSPTALAAPTTVSATASATYAALDSRLPNWPVKDQGSRGTCVAFAVAACAELKLQRRDLSEQFLFWAIKANHDPQRQADGTSLNYAQSALSIDGICTDSYCAYVPASIPVGTFQGGPPPSPAAIGDAAGRTLTGNFNGGGTANAVYNSVAAGRPTCIALPVFTSVSPLGGNNWTSLSGQTRGRVLDPRRDR